MEQSIQDRVDPNQPAPFDENFLKGEKPCWLGLPFEHTFTVGQINSRYVFLDEWQLERGRVMFRGDKQWTEEDSVRRLSQGRPKITFNMIPALLARARCNSTNVGETPSIPQLERCAAILGLENSDPQRMWNYQASMIAEMKMQTPPRIIMSADSLEWVDENGTILVKPPRSRHRNWFVRVLDRVTRCIDRKA